MNKKICIIGVGYVGLALSLRFGKLFTTIAYDIDNKKIENLKKGIDLSSEFSKNDIECAVKLSFTNNEFEIRQSNIYIITVGTPVHLNGKPDLSSLISACETVGRALKHHDLVIIESTVYPGATNELCIPLLEKVSKLKYKDNFNVAYSPERLSPGNTGVGIDNAIKVVSADDTPTAQYVADLYKSIIPAGIYISKSIKVAEAAKVIENTQRDLNIALMNELSIIFKNLNINIYDVIETASTKWNFHNYYPGLVGGHCISVDPYYLLHKSESTGYLPTLIHSSRRINEFMIMNVANLVTNFFKRNSRILILGFSFKENCSDIRNTKVFSLYTELISRDLTIEIYDPRVIKEEVKKLYEIDILESINIEDYDSIIFAVNHIELHEKLKKYIIECDNKSISIFDITGSFRYITSSNVKYCSL